jgi:hypothetical protein
MKCSNQKGAVMEHEKAAAMLTLKGRREVK